MNKAMREHVPSVAKAMGVANDNPGLCSWTMTMELARLLAAREAK
jgi:hypothetical protein